MNDFTPNLAARGSRRIERREATVIETDVAAATRDYDYNDALDPLPVEAATVPKGFAGFSWTRIGVTAAAIGALLWGGWVTTQVLELRRHRVVSVSIASMANDFIGAESRSGNSAEQTEVDTRAYMATLQKVLKDRAADGETIIVSEAVIGASVPDITSEVREAVGKIMSASPPPRVSGRAAGPALAPVAPSVPQGMQQAVPQAPQGGYAPQGAYAPQSAPQSAPPQAQPPMDAQPQSPFDGGPLGADDGQGAPAQ